MAYSVITSKGQITIPKIVRKKLNLKTGDKVDFKIEKGQVRMIPVSRAVSEVFGILSRKSQKPVSIEQIDQKMKKAIKDKNI